MDHSPIHHHDVPGTVRLIDVSGMNSGGPHDSQHKDIVFVPRPSSDPKDPLNWTYRRKLLAVSMAYLYVLRTGIVTSLQYSFGSNFLAPLVAGWFNDAYGWRWTMHFGAIICPVCFVVMFFFMEETMYSRGTLIESQVVEDTVRTGTMRDKAHGEDESRDVGTDSQNDSQTSTPTLATKQSITSEWGKYTWFKALPGQPSNIDMLCMVYQVPHNDCTLQGDNCYGIG
ncbi:hypothetical protein FSHL1_010219 [Fusarium sambucinum]